MPQAGTCRYYYRVLWVLFCLFVAAAEAASFQIVEATIPEMQAALRSGAITSKQLVQLYLERIDKYDRNGLKLNSIRHLNPRALEIAEEKDRERTAGHAKGPLFGIPVLLKDNIDTADQPTTAGSVALEGSVPPKDAFLTRRLRDAGAIILGKANLTEFANYIAEGMPAGYSSLGGYVFNPYNPNIAAEGDGRPALSPGGSSAGPGAAVAANLAAVSVGTETSGSILSPSSQNCLAGIKPTVGLISRTGVIPIAASQDTAGPMARTVTDAAILLGVLAGVDPEDPATAAARHKAHHDYAKYLKKDGLKGARIGVCRARYWDSLRDDGYQIMQDAIAKMQELGAEMVEIDIPGARDLSASKSSVLRYEFKRDLNAYLARLGPAARVHSLAEVIAFNEERKALKYGQKLALASQNTDLEKEKDQYHKDRDADLLLSRKQGIDFVMREYDLDALLFPSNFGANIGAKAGYPSVIVPGGFLSNGSPFGIAFTGPAFSEPVLIRLAYAFEQATKFRRPAQATP